MVVLSSSEEEEVWESNGTVKKPTPSNYLEGRRSGVCLSVYHSMILCWYFCFLLPHHVSSLVFGRGSTFEILRVYWDYVWRTDVIDSKLVFLFILIAPLIHDSCSVSVHGVTEDPPSPQTPLWIFENKKRDMFFHWTLILSLLCYSPCMFRFASEMGYISGIFQWS
jgi:hypothetical protein